MITMLNWVKTVDSDANPVVTISHQPHNSEKPVKIVFRLGPSVVEIYTDENGLNRIGDAVVGYPDQLRRQAEAELLKAIRTAESMGIHVPDKTTKEAV